MDIVLIQSYKDVTVQIITYGIVTFIKSGVGEENTHNPQKG